MMKLYLAHPLKCRAEIRKAELEFEARNPDIQLINPFYDNPERADVSQLDNVSREAWSKNLDFMDIVLKDTQAIDSSGGTVAWVEKTVHTIGTYMELWYTMSQGKLVYVITPDWANHPWLRYVAYKGAGKIFSSFQEFETFIKIKK